MYISDIWFIFSQQEDVRSQGMAQLEAKGSLAQPSLGLSPTSWTNSGKKLFYADWRCLQEAPHAGWYLEQSRKRGKSGSLFTSWKKLIKPRRCLNRFALVVKEMYTQELTVVEHSLCKAQAGRRTVHNIVLKMCLRISLHSRSTGSPKEMQSSK